MTPEDRDLLLAAAYLHIGYSPALVHTGFHPLDGARYLHRTGRPGLARLVAQHSGAAVEARHRGLTRDLAAFPAWPGPVADALAYSDTTTGPRGESVDPGPRYEEIIDRHGRDSMVARSRLEARVDIFAAVIRTLRRVSAARPDQPAFTVETVLLGCTSLVRPQGTLATSDATDDLAADAAGGANRCGAHRAPFGKARSAPPPTALAPVLGLSIHPIAAGTGRPSVLGGRPVRGHVDGHRGDVHEDREVTYEPRYGGPARSAGLSKPGRRDSQPKAVPAERACSDAYFSIMTSRSRPSCSA
jgi:hypothetical protein